jgi:hypothetical protein
VKRPRPFSSELLLLGLFCALIGLRHPFEVAADMRSRRFDPEVQRTAIEGLAAFWSLFYFVFSFAWLGLWAALRGLHLIGHGALVPVFLFVGVFSVAGMVDALWRDILVGVARRRYRRADRSLDATTRRLLRIAQVNDATLLLQLAAGLVFALHLWSRV